MPHTRPIVIASLLALAACGGKKSDPTPGSGSPGGSSTVAAIDAAAAGSGVGSGSSTTPAVDADHITVFASHKRPKPGDPVQIKFEKYAVTKASVDPAKLDGATATIEIDVTSLSSGKLGRDEHLQKADYLDAPKFATIVIDVSNVKVAVPGPETEDRKTYTADAKVTALGTSKTYPVTFEVVGGDEKHVTIKAKHEFSRLDFKIGKDPADPDESVAAEVSIDMQLTLPKT